MRKNHTKNKLNETKNGLNKLNNNDTINESISLLSIDINEMKAKNEAIYEKNLLKILLNFLSQKKIKFFFIVLSLIIIAFLIKFSVKKKNKMKRYIIIKENLDKNINKNTKV